MNDEPVPEDWGNEAKPIDAVTIGDMEKLAQKGRDLRARKRQLEQDAAEVEGELKTVQKQIASYLEHFGLTNYSSAGGKIFVQSKRSVKVPKGEAERDAFFSWLKERQIFDQLVTVNSATLNALYNRECEAAGGEVSIPGLGPASEYKVVVFK